MLHCLDAGSKQKLQWGKPGRYYSANGISLHQPLSTWGARQPPTLPEFTLPFPPSIPPSCPFPLPCSLQTRGRSAPRPRSASPRPTSRTPAPASYSAPAASYSAPAAAPAGGLSAEQREFLERKARESRSPAPVEVRLGLGTWVPAHFWRDQPDSWACGV